MFIYGENKYKLLIIKIGDKKMKNKFRSIKATLIMGLILVSVFATVVPISSAGLLSNLQSFVNVDYDQSITNDPIKIRGTGKAFTLNITYGVTSASLLGISNKFLFAMHKGRTVTLQVELKEYPEWASVSISSWPTATIQDEKETYPVTITVKVNENAPAFGTGDIKLTITVPDVGLIKGVSTEVDIPFSVGYTPVVQHQYLESNTKIIGPMDTAVFPIQLINMGNARTEVRIELTYVPDGWSAIITDNVILEEGEGSKAIIYLTVKPPKSFGYHDDSATINIKYTPYMVEQPEFFGSSKPMNVLVESRGISVIGMEVLVIPIIIIVLVIFLLYYFVLKKRFVK